jgi:hypothetical protein
MTDRGAVTNSIIHALIVALRAEGWQIRPPSIVKEKRPPQFWKDADVEFVRVKWPDSEVSTAAICARVGRTLEAVKHMAAKIGVQRPVGRPAKKPVNLGLPQDQRFSDAYPEFRDQVEKTGYAWQEPTIAEVTEVVSLGVAPKAVAPKMPDRDPLPAPRKAKRGGTDQTGSLMGDPGHGNPREAAKDYSKGGSALS